MTCRCLGMSRFGEPVEARARLRCHVDNGFERADRLPTASRHGVGEATDDGFTLVEVLIVVVLLGLVSGGVLAAMEASIRGSALHRKLATSTAWLQTTSDNLALSGVLPCTNNDPETVRSVYEQQLRTTATVDNSDGWTSSQIAVESVKFWNGNAFVGTCSGGLQDVMVRVQSPTSGVMQRLEIIKGPLSASGIVVTPPGAPGTVTAKAATKSVTVTWAAPAYNGGATITGYTVTAAPGAATCATTGPLSCTVAGLITGNSYTFTVVASNSAGSSVASASSPAATPT